MPTAKPQLPNYQPPGPMPPFVQANPQTIEQQAVSTDQQAYGLSDADFKQRYPQLATTQQTFLNNLQTQMGGNVAPQMQNLWARSGLSNALQSTGGWSMGTGTAGMSNVARNLGLNQMQYQQQLLNQFQMANNTFKPRTFGLSGGDTAQIALSNIAGQNNWNQSNYAYQVAESQYSTGLKAQQAVLGANASNAQTSNLVSGGSAVAAVAVVAFCWLARSAYGPYNPRWQRFRYFMLARAPRALKAAYVRYGPTLARTLDANSWAKPAVRAVMELLTWRLAYASLPL